MKRAAQEDTVSERTYRLNVYSCGGIQLEGIPLAMEIYYIGGTNPGNVYVRGLHHHWKYSGMEADTKCVLCSLEV